MLPRFSRFAAGSYSRRQALGRLQMSTASAKFPICLVVTVEIKDNRIEDFLKVIEEDAIGSRTKENGGCLRFDVLRSQTQANKFIFYEMYKDENAVAFHKASAHFKLWSDFKASGGVLSQSVEKADGIFL